MNLNHLTIFWRFILLGIVVFVVIGIVLSDLVAPTLTRFILEQQKLSSVVFANRLAYEFLLEEDFAQPATGKSLERFENFANNLQVPGLFRVKIWNPEGVIVYSDKKELIGKEFPPTLNQPLLRALKLQTVVDWVIFGPENLLDYSELSFKEAIKTDAPITFGASTKVAGVVETFARVGFLKEQINTIKNQFMLRVILSLVLMFSILSFIVWRASKTVDQQRAELQKYAIGLEKMVADRTKKLAHLTQQQLKHADEMVRLKNEFVSLAAHQLRTPPSIVSWYTELLLSDNLGSLNEKQRDYLEEIYKANQRMIELVNVFLNVSRIEMGTLPIELKSTDLRPISDSALGEFLHLIKNKNLKVEKDYDQDLPMIDTDPRLARIILQNLLSNAVKYVQKEGIIKLSIKQEKSPAPRILIQVSDNGYGIPKDQQSKIFTKLFRADNVRVRETDGTGLGLYLVKMIVNLLGGAIWFNSEENRGSTFFVAFPLK